MYDGIVFLTVGPSPGIVIRSIVRAWGPLIAGVTVTWASNGDLRTYLGQIATWRVRPRWYILAIVLPFVLDGSLTVSVVHVFTGGAVRIAPSPWWQYILGFLLVMFLLGGLEEFGWRGFAQSRLQERYTAFTAAVGIGIAWALWHLPMFYLYDVPAYDVSGFWTTYLFTLIVQSITLAWLYNSTRGAVLLPMLYHSLGNLPALVEPVGDVGIIAERIPEVLSILLVVSLIAFYGRRSLASSAPDPLIPGAIAEQVWTNTD
ncbi:CPBP family intramembrane glutamic endopeptidase [Natrinema caseinilyticum]|uniref:CPBP family intramembrane glutamic endopeptidase n=1 Tax=Natrinema caseinilyticum TaxID=2961570 RepID=UPI0020C4BAC2|nr:CPBP family intramembrane glutamic endopeptidase [Natrinema caseinilyticum]